MKITQKTTYIQNPCTCTTFNITLHYKVNDRASRMYIAHSSVPRNRKIYFPEMLGLRIRQNGALSLKPLAAIAFPVFLPLFYSIFNRLSNNDKKCGNDLQLTPQRPTHLTHLKARPTLNGKPQSLMTAGSLLAASAFDQTYTPRSSRLPGTVLSKITATRNAITM